MQLKRTLKDSLEQRAYQEILESQVDENDDTSKNENDLDNDDPNAGEPPNPKRRKRVRATDLRTASWEDRIRTLNEYFGTGSVLDLTKILLIPKLLKSSVDDICKHYRLVLPILLKNNEYTVLKDISKCHTKQDLYQSVEKIDPFCDNSELPFIKLAIQKLCSLWHRNILEGDHNEDWYRVMAYGDLFDFIFCGQTGYETKRAECHSLIVKSLKAMGLLNTDTKNVRLDFIFSHNGGFDDAFYCEDKPNKNTFRGAKKTKNLRVQALAYWISFLPYEECIKYITAITCQFNKLKLQITCTKIIAGVTLHSVLKEAKIPNTDQGGASVAEYLATVISLVRIVIQNFEIIKLIIDIAKEDDLVFLSSTLTPNTIYREDSPLSSSSSSISSLSSQNWEAEERKIRILQKIDAAITGFTENNEYVAYSWEDIVYLQNEQTSA
ncbi:unnamed protein product [Rhizopus stolonifer]